MALKVLKVLMVWMEAPPKMPSSLQRKPLQDVPTTGLSLVVAASTPTAPMPTGAAEATGLELLSATAMDRLKPSTMLKMVTCPQQGCLEEIQGLLLHPTVLTETLRKTVRMDKLAQQEVPRASSSSGSGSKLAMERKEKTGNTAQGALAAAEATGQVTTFQIRVMVKSLALPAAAAALADVVVKEAAPDSVAARASA